MKRHSALNVKAGEVAVIKSNVQELADCPSSEVTAHPVKAASGSAMSVTLLPKGCIGVWSEPLLPGRYYLNEEAYTATIIPTRARTGVYIGGYEKRRIDLTVSDDGQVHQEASSRSIPKPADAADQAIIVTAEG